MADKANTIYDVGQKAVGWLSGGTGSAAALGTGGLWGTSSGIGASAITGAQGAAAITPGAGFWTAAPETLYGAGLGSSSATAAGASSSNGALSNLSGFMSSAPGIGIISGLATGLLTGDWGQAAKTGIGTGVGFALGGPLGAAAGGIISNIIGNSEPSNDPAVYSVNLNTGAIKDRTGSYSPSASLNNSVKSTAENLGKMSSMIREVIPGAKFSGNIGLDIGTRDDPGIWEGNKLTNYSKEQYDQKLAETFMSKLTGVSPAVKDAISKVDFSNPTTAKQQLQYIKENIVR